MRIAFFGSSRLSCIVLRRVLESRHAVAAVVSQPDQPAGRRMELKPTPLALEALTIGLPVLKPEKLRHNSELERQLRQLDLDALLVASYGKIIPSPVLELTAWPLNVHPSLLPDLRGASPIRTALLRGYARTGCSIMSMTPRLDDGDLLAREALDIAPEWNYEELETQLGELGGEMAVRALDLIGQGGAGPKLQDHEAATYCGEYSRADTWIDWSRPATELSSFVRAWDPDLGALATMPDGKRLKVWRADAVEQASNAAPGEVLGAGRGGLVVAAGRGALSLREVQPESKRRMGIEQFLAGRAMIPGERFGPL